MADRIDHDRIAEHVVARLFVGVQDVTSEPSEEEERLLNRIEQAVSDAVPVGIVYPLIEVKETANG